TEAVPVQDVRQWSAGVWLCLGQQRSDQFGHRPGERLVSSPPVARHLYPHDAADLGKELLPAAVDRRARTRVGWCPAVETNHNQVCAISGGAHSPSVRGCTNRDLPAETFALDIELIKCRLIFVGYVDRGSETT